MSITRRFLLAPSLARLLEQERGGRDILEGHDIAVNAVILLKDQAHLAFQQIAAIGRGSDELSRRAVG